METHEHLIKLHEENTAVRHRSIKKTAILAVFFTLIMLTKIAFFKSASSNVNIVVIACASILVFWHFKNFKHRLDLNEKKVSIILEGVQLEQSNSSSKASYFQDYLNKFTPAKVLGLTANATFDFAFLYFFCMLIIPLLKETYPAIITNTTPFASIIKTTIIACAILLYYQPIRPLIFLKKELAKS